MIIELKFYFAQYKKQPGIKQNKQTNFKCVPDAKSIYGCDPMNHIKQTKTGCCRSRQPRVILNIGIELKSKKQKYRLKRFSPLQKNFETKIFHS